MTTSGWRLESYLERLVEARPDKVHVSIHFPQNQAEVEHVIGLVQMLDAAGLRSGINLLVDREQLVAAGVAAAQIRDAGIATSALSICRCGARIRLPPGRSPQWRVMNRFNRPVVCQLVPAVLGSVALVGIASRLVLVYSSPRELKRA